ncbi:hypothetical protein H6G80_28400 [Nostoc sp. FACHB-87]|uniref:hypothetical protein n=1 Tax=Nostocaceae TaxID=1162 RepID=UPI001689D8D7|nr:MULTISPECIES: hypothetical protein [Nostocaceae]MBD2457973.1 hypothetical protein [Nostoc sp. FACHB-87]MBD2479250.1 hypothetical protein [Anabaena sp. FACHB-83]
MAVLSQDQIERIELLCGYAQFQSLTRSQLQLDFTQSVVDRVAEILSQLDTIDAQLVQVREDNYVTESRGTKLNYAYHTKQLRLSGLNLLKELASILGITLLKNRYLPGDYTNISYW